MHPTAPKLTAQKMKLLYFLPLTYQKFVLMVLQPLGYEGFVDEFQGWCWSYFILSDKRSNTEKPSEVED